MSPIVHVQTVVRTIFGTLDADNNVIPQEPVVVNVLAFNADGFAEAHAVIARRRAEIEAGADA